MKEKTANIINMAGIIISMIAIMFMYSELGIKTSIAIAFFVMGMILYFKQFVIGEDHE